MKKFQTAGAAKNRRKKGNYGLVRSGPPPPRFRGANGVCISHGDAAVLEHVVELLKLPRLPIRGVARRKEKPGPPRTRSKLRKQARCDGDCRCAKLPALLPTLAPCRWPANPPTEIAPRASLARPRARSANPHDHANEDHHGSDQKRAAQRALGPVFSNRKTNPLPAGNRGRRPAAKVGADSDAASRHLPNLDTDAVQDNLQPGAEENKQPPLRAYPHAMPQSNVRPGSCQPSSQGATIRCGRTAGPAEIP